MPCGGYAMAEKNADGPRPRKLHGARSYLAPGSRGIHEVLNNSEDERRAIALRQDAATLAATRAFVGGYAVWAVPLGRLALAAACNLRWNFIRLASPAQCTSSATAA